jgi:CrcB protein
MNFLLIGLGGGIGAICRYLMVIGCQRLANGWYFPIGTLVVNISGCFLIGLLAGLSEYRGLFGSDARLFLLVGLLGGYTTFSSFGYETFQLLRDGQLWPALINGGAQLALGIIGVWFGNAAARALS